jgi:hypothetical protein
METAQLFSQEHWIIDLLFSALYQAFAKLSRKSISGIGTIFLRINLMYRKKDVVQRRQTFEKNAVMQLKYVLFFCLTHLIYGLAI